MASATIAKRCGFDHCTFCPRSLRSAWRYARRRSRSTSRRGSGTAADAFRPASEFAKHGSPDCGATPRDCPRPASVSDVPKPPRRMQPGRLEAFSRANLVRARFGAGIEANTPAPTDRRLSGHGRACRSCPHARRCNRRAKSFDADCRRGLSCGALWHLGDFTELVLRLTKISTAVPPPFRRAASKSARPRRDTRPQ
ncbi:hypothetical protein ABIF64_006656 [Bradyrhizobium japonicum]